jgi:hypothetical protein
MKKMILILFLSFSFFAFDMRAVNAQDSHQMDEFLTLFPKAKDSLNGLEVSDYKEVVLLVALTTKNMILRSGLPKKK